MLGFGFGGGLYVSLLLLTEKNVEVFGVFFVDGENAYFSDYI